MARYNALVEQPRSEPNGNAPDDTREQRPGDEPGERRRENFTDAHLEVSLLLRDEVADHFIHNV